MSNSYVLGIAVGIAFGIMFVAFIFSYLKKKGKDICEYDERQKLAQLRPLNLGQASRISGVSPADVAVLMIALEKTGGSGEQGKDEGQ